MTLEKLLAGSPYQGYSYGYPHKTAYRPLTPALSLEELWAVERREALFLYVHIPFCEMRCGFCNLFTHARPRHDLVSAYLFALTCQANVVRQALGPARFARCAIGGGTPTYLEWHELERLLQLMEHMTDGGLATLPTSVEVSPETATLDKLAVLRDYGVERVSIGVQSFLEEETAAVGRPQKRRDVDATFDLIHHLDFPTLNIDLIYGLPGQDVASWLNSIEAALTHRPEELYLYPLYVRPLTGLGKSPRQWDDIRLECYRAGAALLRSHGYTQVSMRMFQRAGAAATDGPVYCCQDDGMVGLGCGARSYTRGLHYATEYAVGVRGVRAIVDDYVARADESFAHADYGIALDGDEQRRRFVIQSLLQTSGLDFAAYRRRFQRDVFAELPQLGELETHELAWRADGALRLNDEGMARSDVIGPWLYSPCVRRRMAEYEAR